MISLWKAMVVVYGKQFHRGARANSVNGDWLTVVMITHNTLLRHYICQFIMFHLNFFFLLACLSLHCIGIGHLRLNMRAAVHLLAFQCVGLLSHAIDFMLRVKCSRKTNNTNVLIRKGIFLFDIFTRSYVL